METINDRMDLIVKERFGGNKSAFAKAISVEPTTLSSYLSAKRRSKPSVDMVAKIITALDVDPRWLLLGERGSDMYINETNNNQINGTRDHDFHAEITDNTLLKERIKSLEALLAEKERLIQVLMGIRYE